MAELTREQERAAVLARARVIAVLGAHSEQQRPAFYVPDYLHEMGYRVIPVNPLLAGQELWGEPVRASLADIGEPVDVVDVFRRPDQLGAHLPELLAMRPAPAVVWFQLGIRNDEVAAALVDAGMDVVQDACTLADHRRFRRSGLLLDQQLAALREALDAGVAGRDDDGEAADQVREVYGELLEQYRADPDALSRVREVGRLIEEAVQRGDLPRALIRRGPRD
ncbi:MAG TPA: CoA-binding protein [Kofleriaceae bacterium]|nr:CoA-binding protein [Kofleriaceae bacterium]